MIGEMNIVSRHYQACEERRDKRMRLGYEAKIFDAIDKIPMRESYAPSRKSRIPLLVADTSECSGLRTPSIILVGESGYLPNDPEQQWRTEIHIAIKGSEHIVSYRRSLLDTTLAFEGSLTALGPDELANVSSSLGKIASRLEVSQPPAR